MADRAYRSHSRGRERERFESAQRRSRAHGRGDRQFLRDLLRRSDAQRRPVGSRVIPVPCFHFISPRFFDYSVDPEQRQGRLRRPLRGNP